MVIVVNEVIYVGTKKSKVALRERERGRERTEKRKKGKNRQK